MKGRILTTAGRPPATSTKTSDTTARTAFFHVFIKDFLRIGPRGSVPAAASFYRDRRRLPPGRRRSPERAGAVPDSSVICTCKHGARYEHQSCPPTERGRRDGEHGRGRRDHVAGVDAACGDGVRRGEPGVWCDCDGGGVAAQRMAARDPAVHLRMSIMAIEDRPTRQFRPGAVVGGVVLLALGAGLLIDRSGVLQLHHLTAPLVLIVLGAVMSLEHAGFVYSIPVRDDEGKVRFQTRQRRGLGSGMWLIWIGIWM